MPKDTQTKSLNSETFQVEVRANALSELYVRIHFLHNALYGIFKRLVDLVLAVFSVVFLLPTFLILAIAIKIDSPGPILFKQERVGKNGKVFKILKFRSMVCDNDVRDNSCEDKYTRVGKLIRRTSLDEIPQLLNVIAGQMSFVGPRPWIVEYWDNMNEEERMRAKVRPGITGLAQVKGRNGISIFEKIRYDLIYVDNFSLRQDVKIVLMTMKTVVSGVSVDAGKAGVRDDIRELKARRLA